MNAIRSSRRPILLGFSLMLALLLGMGALGLNYMSGMQERLDVIVQVRNQRTELMSNMRNIARERSLILFQMNLKRDPFFTDEAKVRMSDLAGQFIGMRDRLRALTPDADSSERLYQILKDVTYSTGIQRDVVRLIEQQRHDEADSLLTDKSIPVQNALLQKYDRFVATEQQRAADAAREAAEHYRLSLYSMAALGTVLLGLGLVVSVYVVRQVTGAEAELRVLNSSLEDRVSERTRALSTANADLARTLDQLRETQSQLVQSEKMAAMGALVAGISHEINTPVGVAMTAVTHQQERIGEVQRAYQQGTITRSQLEAFIDENQHASDIIVGNLRRASELITSFKRVAVDQSQEHWEAIDLHDYLQDVIRSLQPRFKRSRIEIRNRCPEGLTLFTNPGAIYQIFSNLLLNSLHHGFEPGASGRITLDCQCDDDGLQLVYRDDGRGMSAEEQHRAFDPFFTTRRGEGGSGLGLHIVYNLVTSGLHGNIALDSRPGGGVRFDIRLPRQAPATA